MVGPSCGSRGGTWWDPLEWDSHHRVSWVPWWGLLVGPTLVGSDKGWYRPSVWPIRWQGEWWCRLQRPLSHRQGMLQLPPSRCWWHQALLQCDQKIMVSSAVGWRCRELGRKVGRIHTHGALWGTLAPCSPKIYGSPWPYKWFLNELPKYVELKNMLYGKFFHFGM